MLFNNTTAPTELTDSGSRDNKQCGALLQDLGSEIGTGPGRKTKITLDHLFSSCSEFENLIKYANK